MQKLASRLMWALLAAVPAGAQIREPSDGGIVASLGQPTLWKWTTGAATGWRLGRGLGPDVMEARLGAYRDLTNPLYGIAALHLEAHAGARNGEPSGGARVRLVVPSARIGVGAEYTSLDHRVRLVLSAFHPVWRGGLFHDGSLLRVDYSPGRDQSLLVGFETPIYRRIPTGKTRPDADHVELSGAPLKHLSSPNPSLGLDVPLWSARESAAWIRMATVPYLSQHSSGPAADTRVIAELLELKRALATTGAGGVPHTRTMDAQVRAYHAEVARAFSIAVAGRSLSGSDPTPEGRAVAAQANAVLLAEVLLPYDRLLGQVKRPDGLADLGSRAEGIFLRQVYTSGTAPPAAVNDVMWIFHSLIAIIDENRAAALAEWRDSRYVWLPLQYALLPEDHDTQAELDALVERAVRDSFTEGNFVSYLINEQYQFQLNRSIRDAEDYHVLWTHDVRGYDDKCAIPPKDCKGPGDPDEMSYRQVLVSYLHTMTERVRAYDRTGKFPVYMIFLDEWFYEVRRGRLWMNLLEDPTRYRLHLPKGFEPWEDSIVAEQDSLRAAIAGSRLLQAQRRRFGERWLHQLIKVHVNITNPADPSFWSWSITRGIPMPDNMMRDHQKLAFYDLSEDDPYRGAAIFTGAGVGEHYANLAWEDRSILVSGPAVLELKYAAARALTMQGMPPGEIPYPLRPRAKAGDYDAKVRNAPERNQQPLRALTLHNGTGFDFKQINVAKGVLYTLMPPGSVINIPDSIWNDEFWGAALFGGALRGVRVLVIAPSNDNNPVAAFGSRQLTRELMRRLFAASTVFAPEITAAGGVLKIGIFTTETPVNAIPAKLRAVQATLTKYAWLRELFDISPRAYASLAQVIASVDSLNMDPTGAKDFEYDPRPKLHLKANFFASREAWRLMSRPEWAGAMRNFIIQRVAQVQTRFVAVHTFEDTPDAMIDLGEDMVANWLASLDPATRERTVFYTIMGSQNQNYRSMVTDGEDAFVVANLPGVIPYLDLISIIGQCRWIESSAELDSLIPAQRGLLAPLTHWFKLIF